MSSLSLRLPDFLHRKIRELAEQDHISINQFIATAVAEKGGGAADCGVSRGAWPPSGSQLGSVAQPGCSAGARRRIARGTKPAWQDAAAD